MSTHSSLAVLAAGDPVENVKSWVIAILIGALYVAVIVGLVRSAFKFTPVAIIGGILLGAIILAAPFLVPAIATSVKDKSESGPTQPAADWMSSGDLFSGSGSATTTAPANGG
jgi:hypothetical protein